jgi:excinuclease ABC subunit C
MEKSTLKNMSRDRMAILREKIAKLPQNPGVYFFRGANGEILYIGKATNLRTRVQSYFRSDANLRINANQRIANGANGKGTKSPIGDLVPDRLIVPGRSEWIGRMVALVEDIDFQETDSVLEALILESNLIKKYQPKYNTDEKDDKSFSYFVITKEEYPRVIIVRGTDLDKYDANLRINANQRIANKFIKDVVIDKVYGPYVSKYQMQVALKIIRRIFPFHALKQKSEKGCLDYQIGMCPGPYDGVISKEDYKKNIRGIRMILEGKKKRLITTLEKEMKEAAKKHEFEKAADLRNKIFALQHIRDVALISKEFESGIEHLSPKTQNLKPIRIEAYDISNISGQHAVGSMVVFDGDKPDKSQYRKFKIKTVEGSDDVGMMLEVLLRRFKNDWPMPDLVLLDGGQGHVNMAEKLLYGELGLSVPIVGVAKGPSRKNLELRISNYEQNSKFKIQNSVSAKSLENKKTVNNILQNKLLVKNIMDEAHRFAISYHRKLRRKNYLK